MEIRSYAGKLSGPLLDRVDLQVHVPPVQRAAFGDETGEASAVVAARVAAARAAQRDAVERLGGWAHQRARARARPAATALPTARPSTTAVLDRTLDTGRLTLRGYDRVLRVAWSAADLAGRTVPAPDDVALGLDAAQRGAGGGVTARRQGAAGPGDVERARAGGDGGPGSPGRSSPSRAAAPLTRRPRGVRRRRVAGPATGRPAASTRGLGGPPSRPATSTTWPTPHDRQGLHVLVPGDDGLARAGWTASNTRPTASSCGATADLASLVERSVAVVGSRAATEYGMRVAADLADGLVGRGWTVVSGAAYGIDAAAHRAALAADGPDRRRPRLWGRPRLPVVPSRPPRRDRPHRGAVVSEVPPGWRPFRSRFLARNRLIATLTRATVVVEASLRSGSLTTAREARTPTCRWGRYPGPVTSMGSAGCHALVRDTGAVLVTDAAEVAELAGRIGEDLAPGSAGADPGRPPTTWTPLSYAVWSAVPVRGGATSERLAAAAGVPVAEAARGPRGPGGRRAGRAGGRPVAQGHPAAGARRRDAG